MVNHQLHCIFCRSLMWQHPSSNYLFQANDKKYKVAGIYSFKVSTESNLFMTPPLPSLPPPLNIIKTFQMRKQLPFYIPCLYHYFPNQNYKIYDVHLPLQPALSVHQNNLWNMFKVNVKDIRTMSLIYVKILIHLSVQSS